MLFYNCIPVVCKVKEVTIGNYQKTSSTSSVDAFICAEKSWKHIDLVNDTDREKSVTIIWVDNVGMPSERTRDLSILNSAKSYQLEIKKLMKVYHLLMTSN